MWFLWLIAMCLSFSTGCNSKPGAVAIHLSPTTIDCVVGEPVRLAVSMKNVSRDTLRVLPVEALTDGQWLFTYFEVTYPDGHVERRRYQTRFIYAIWTFETAGVPLAPGDSLYFLAYPGMTRIRVNRDGTDKQQGASDARTFPKPGKYRVRAVVHFWPEFKNLYTGAWRSNETTLIVREPDSVSAKILDAVQSCGSLSEGTACMPTELEQLVQEYPTHPMIKYAQLAIAHAHRWGQPGEHNADLPRAIDEYRSVAETYPDLFPEEVQLRLAGAYRDAGRQDEAQRVIADLLAAHPELWTDYRFAWAGAVIGTNSTAGMSAGARWDEWKQKERKTGAQPLDLERYRSRTTD